MTKELKGVDIKLTNKAESPGKHCPRHKEPRILTPYLKLSFQLVVQCATCIGLPYLQYQLILSWYLHQPEKYQLSLNEVSE